MISIDDDTVSREEREAAKDGFPEGKGVRAPEVRRGVTGIIPDFPFFAASRAISTADSDTVSLEERWMGHPEHEHRRCEEREAAKRSRCPGVLPGVFSPEQAGEEPPGEAPREADGVLGADLMTAVTPDAARKIDRRSAFGDGDRLHGADPLALPTADA